MTTTEDRLIALDVQTCTTLLRSRHVGRLAVNEGTAPVILPVNYVLDTDNSIVIRTAPGTKLAWAERSNVAFEVDDIAEDLRLGWSVLVRGRAMKVSAYDGELYERLAALPLEPWAGGEKNNIVRIVPYTITGRRIRPA